MFGLSLSAQPSVWWGGIGDDDVHLSFGVKFTADVRIAYFTFGICYNPWDLKMSAPNTATYVGETNSQYFLVKPALEVRFGVNVWGMFE